MVSAVKWEEAKEACKLSGWPTTIVVDKQGRIINRWIGVLTEDEIRALHELIAR
jgi:hypothetical protein